MPNSVAKWSQPVITVMLEVSVASFSALGIDWYRLRFRALSLSGLFKVRVRIPFASRLMSWNSKRERLKFWSSGTLVTSRDISYSQNCRNVTRSSSDVEEKSLAVVLDAVGPAATGETLVKSLEKCLTIIVFRNKGYLQNFLRHSRNVKPGIRIITLRNNRCLNSIKLRFFLSQFF